jgi:Glyoxalase-like domain
MAIKFQVTFDCDNPGQQTRFWAAALDYKIQDPPGGFGSWNAYWRSIGVPDEELDDADDSSDSIVDPDGAGPRIWFQKVPEPKAVKNRLHLDLDAGGGRTVPLQTRKERVSAAAQRLAQAGATMLRTLEQEGLDHFAIVMQDPEGNEFCVH